MVALNPITSIMKSKLSKHPNYIAQIVKLDKKKMTKLYTACGKKKIITLKT